MSTVNKTAATLAILLTACGGLPFTMEPTLDALVIGDGGSPFQILSDSGTGADADASGVDPVPDGDAADAGASHGDDAGQADAGEDSGNVADAGGHDADMDTGTIEVDAGPPCIEHTDGVWPTAQSFCFDAPVGVPSYQSAIYSAAGATAACEAYAGWVGTAGGSCASMNITEATGYTCTSDCTVICFAVASACSGYCWVYESTAASGASDDYVGNVYGCVSNTQAGTGEWK